MPTHSRPICLQVRLQRCGQLLQVGRLCRFGCQRQRFVRRFGRLEVGFQRCQLTQQLFSALLSRRSLQKSRELNPRTGQQIRHLARELGLLERQRRRFVCFGFG